MNIPYSSQEFIDRCQKGDMLSVKLFLEAGMSPNAKGKNGISFEQAITAFDDPFGRAMEDPKHSTGREKRIWRIGMSDFGVLVVVFTIRRPGPLYRLISARKASRRERRLYEAYKGV